MKTRAILLASLIVLQLLCLGWMYLSAAAELAASPHEIVDAFVVRGTTVVPKDTATYGKHVEYYLDPYSFSAYRNACRKHGEDRLRLTLEIARRDVDSAGKLFCQRSMATNLFVNGVPIADAVSPMNRGELPQAAH